MSGGSYSRSMGDKIQLNLSSFMANRWKFSSTRGRRTKKIWNEWIIHNFTTQYPSKIILTRVFCSSIMASIDFLSPFDNFTSIHYVGRTFDLKLICLMAANGSMNLNHAPETSSFIHRRNLSSWRPHCHFITHTCNMSMKTKKNNSHHADGGFGI